MNSYNPSNGQKPLPTFDTTTIANIYGELQSLKRANPSSNEDALACQIGGPNWLQSLKRAKATSNVQAMTAQEYQAVLQSLKRATPTSNHDQSQ